MIVPYLRFLERRLERNVQAAERRAREQRQTLEVMPTGAAAVIANPVVTPIALADEGAGHVRNNG
jgi:hypothetical protein